MFGRSTLDYVATNPQFLSTNPNILQLQAKSGKYATNSVANQTEVSGKATLFGMEHSLSAGMEFSWERSMEALFGEIYPEAFAQRSGGPFRMPAGASIAA